MQPLERLVNLVGLLLETRTPLTFEQIRETPRALRAGEGRQREAHVRARQGHPARLRRAARAGRHRRVGHRAGLRDPEGRVLPARDRVHARGARRAVRCRARCPERHAGRGSGAEADGRAPRGACWPGWPAGRSPRGSDARGSLVMAVAAAAQEHRRVRFGYRTSQGHRLGPRRRRVHGAVPRAATGTWSGSTASARRRDRSACRGSPPTSPTRGRGASRPTGSARPTSSRRVRGRRRGRSARRSRSRRTSHGGPPAA